MTRPQEHPLSYAQERLWFLSQLDPADASYNIAMVARLRGPLNEPALTAAFREVIARHGMLRARFLSRDGMPVQVIGEWHGPWLERVDISATPGAVRDARAREIVAGRTSTPFDLTAGPPLRATLITLADDDHVLSVVLHHIAGDGLSLGVLAAELVALYQADPADRPAALPPLPVHYVDYARRQREQLSGGAVDELVGYWAGRLSGAPSTELPADRPRARVRSLSGRQFRCPLPAGAMSRLERISRDCRCTLFMTMLAAFQLLLARHTGQYDVCVGSPIAGRQEADLEPLIGLFSNTLVLRGDLTGDPSFRELMPRIRAVALDAYVHQDVPFELLLNRLDVERDLSRTPLFQTMFSMPGLRESPFWLPGTEAELFEAGIRQARVDLTVEVYPGGEHPVVIFTYNDDLYEEATIRRLNRRFGTLLESIAADPEARLSSLAVIDQSERYQLLEQWNATARPLPPVVSVAEMFAARARRTPHATAVTCQGRDVPYAELAALVDVLADRLRRGGIGPGTVVGVRMHRSVELVAGLLAVQATGAAYLLLDPGYPAARLDFMMADAEVAAVLDSTGLTAAGMPVREQTGTGRPAAEDIAYVMYTSGSTGRPKGVQVTYQALANVLHAMDEVTGDEAGTWLAATSLSFDISALELYLPLISGGRVVLATDAETTDPAALVKLIDEQSVTHVQATPTMWRLLLEAGFRGPAITALAGGEALPLTLAVELRACVRQLWNMYGPTETTIWSACWEVPERTERVLIGSPIANTSIHLLDERLRLVPTGVPGELYIGGAGLARGYLRRPGLTAGRFVADPFGPPGSRLYRTGDLARRRPDGEIEFLGRVDDQVKLHGHRIEPGEIEACLLSHPRVAQAAVVVRAESLVGYVVTGPGDGPVEGAELRRHLAASLPGYMVPGAFVVLGRLPMTANGKLDRSALPAPSAESRDDEAVQAVQAGLDGTAGVVAAIWCEVLRVDSIGPDDDLFDIGGHSLAMLRIAARIRDQLHVNVPLQAFYDVPTVTGIAATIDELTDPSRE
jgi:amino acid adenylation domain-containing protein